MRLVGKTVAVALLLLISSLGLTHWYLVQPLNPPEVSEQTDTTIRCVDDTGVTVATRPTLAEIEAACGQIATERGDTFYIEQHDSVSRVTRTHEIRGSTSVRLNSAQASLIAVGGGGDGVSSGVTPITSGSNNAARIDALLSGYTIAFSGSLAYPSDPVTTTTVSVLSGSCAELQAAINDSTLVNVPAGTYNACNLSIQANDVDLVLDNAATINGDLTCGGATLRSRIRITGGVFNGFWTNDGCSDVLIDNVRLVGTVTGTELHNWSGQGAGTSQRLAAINSSFYVNNGDGGGTWAAYVQQIDDGVNTPRVSDLIFANVRLENDGGQNNRIQDVLRHVSVQSCYNGNGTSTNGLRLHHSMLNVHHEDNVIVGANISTADSENQITNGTFRNVTRYHDTNNAWSNGVGTRASNVTVNNSTCYQTVGTVGTECPLGEATGSNNLIASWDGVTYPDCSAYGADH